MPELPGHVDRGVLFPDRLPTGFHRLPAADDVAHLVGWWWVSIWSVPGGEVSRQQLIAFPASNLVVEADGMGWWGPATRASHRDLTGDGWAVAALLRPAAVPAFTSSPDTLRDDHLPLDEPDVVSAVRSAMAAGHPGVAVAALSAWLVDRVGDVDEDALLANRLVDVAQHDATVLTVDDLAATVHLSARSVHRLTERFVGLTPHALIRRRRLQEAVAQVRDEPDVPLAEVATRHGFTDQAHLTREFRQVLGRTPAAFRRDATASPA